MVDNWIPLCLEPMKAAIARCALRPPPWRVLLAVLLSVVSGVALGDARSWPPIAKDGLRDPAGPATRVLQPPKDALSPLAPDNAGNQVRWVEALKQKQIAPRSALRKFDSTGTYDKDVYLNINGGMPAVRFPHNIHNEWLDCSNCHDHLFKKKRGASQISMFLILQGEQCGVCHGAVAFPLTECSRCHSMKREDALAALAQQEADTAAEKANVAAGATAPPAPARSTQSPPKTTGGGSK